MKKKNKIIIVIVLSCAIIVGSSVGTYFILYALADTPAFELPVHEIDDVTGIQVFHDNRSTSQIHNGFDFELRNDTEIFAPIAGTISLVSKHLMSNGLWIIDVFISFNIKWDMFIAFEPCTTDEAVINDQMLNISVQVGDYVTQNQSLGILNPVNGSEFPHIHWSIREGGLYRSPYDFCSTSARSGIEYLCDKFGKLPEDL